MSEIEVHELLSKIFESKLSVSAIPNESVLKHKGTIPSILAKLECPFTWKYNYTCEVLDIVSRIERQLSEMQDEDNDFLPWKSFVLYLLLCYEYGKEGDVLEAKEKQMECETILSEKSCEQDSQSYRLIGAGLNHISLACKCFIAYECQLFDEVHKTLDMIVPFENLNIRDQANVLCVKGSFCGEYGYSGIKESVKIFEEAVTMDGECGEWFFLLGKSLGRLRRLENRSGIPDQKELKALERAAQLTNNTSFMVLLAQSYRETARGLFIEKKRDWNTFKPFCDSLNQKAKELYRKVLQQEKNSAQNFVRCALGLMKLPNPWKDLPEAKCCILKALDIAPKNPMANHVAGTYYSFVNDYKQSIQHLSKAAASGVFGADIDIIYLKRKQNSTYVPVPDLERLLGVYKEKPHHEAILCYLGGYYYFVEKDFKKALEYWFQVIEEDINSEKLRVYYEGTTHFASNLNKIIVTEICKLLEDRNISKRERELYDKIINKYIEHHPGLVVSVSDIDVSKYKNKGDTLQRSEFSTRNSLHPKSNTFFKNASSSGNKIPSRSSSSICDQSSSYKSGRFYGYGPSSSSGQTGNDLPSSSTAPNRNSMPSCSTSSSSSSSLHCNTASWRSTSGRGRSYRSQEECNSENWERGNSTVRKDKTIFTEKPGEKTVNQYRRKSKNDRDQRMY